MTEAELQRQAEDWLTSAGYLWHHCADPRRCRGPRGFPDLMTLGPRGWLPAELKGPDGETSAEQDRWIWMAHLSGYPIPVFRSGDWDELRAYLRRITR